MKDEHVLMLVGGGLGLYLLYQSREGGLPQFQLPSLGGGVSLDLSNLLGGLGGTDDALGQIKDLLGGLKADDAAVRDFLGSCLPSGGGQQGGNPTDQSGQAAGGGGGGSEPSFGGGDGGGPVSDIIDSLAGTSPIFQGGLGVATGLLGGATAYVMVRTAPAVARGAMYAVEGAAGAARTVGNVISGSLRGVMSRFGMHRTATQTAAGTLRTTGMFRPRIGPMSYSGMPAAGKAALGGTWIAGSLLLAGSAAGTLSTLLGRAMFGEQAPERVAGWPLLSSLSLTEPFWPQKVAASPEGVGAGLFAGSVARGGVGGVMAPSGAGASETLALRDYLAGRTVQSGVSARGQASLSGIAGAASSGGRTVQSGVSARGQASLAGGMSSGGRAPSGGRAAPVTATGMASEADERAYWSYT